MEFTFVLAFSFWKARKESNVQASTFYTKICMLHWIDVSFWCCKKFLHEAKNIFHFGKGLGLQVWWIIKRNLPLLLLFILWCWNRIIMMHQQTKISECPQIDKRHGQSFMLSQFTTFTQFWNVDWIISFDNRFYFLLFLLISSGLALLWKLSDLIVSFESFSLLSFKISLIIGNLSNFFFKKVHHFFFLFQKFMEFLFSCLLGFYWRFSETLECLRTNFFVNLNKRVKFWIMSHFNTLWLVFFVLVCFGFILKNWFKLCSSFLSKTSFIIQRMSF